ncbi:Transcriptional regulatory protein LiaR [compost metagenome]
MSQRELRILAHLCQGAEIRVIASQVDLAEKTLRNTLTAIYRKLNVSSRSQAMAYGHRHGIGRSPVVKDA